MPVGCVWARCGGRDRLALSLIQNGKVREQGHNGRVAECVMEMSWLDDHNQRTPFIKIHPFVVLLEQGVTSGIHYRY